MTISQNDHAKVLAALYNASAPLGMGFLQYDPNPMTEKEAERLLEDYNYFDYLKGRLMKVSFASEDISLSSYNRDNGASWGETAIELMYAIQDVNCPEIQKMHKIRMEGGKEYTRELMQTPTSSPKEINGVQVISLGLDDVAYILRPAVDNA